MTVLDYVRRVADHTPNKAAIVAKDVILTYNELHQMMSRCEPLPIPLLGDSWEGDFCLYTTGTTGQSKGVVISQEAVIANSENLIEAHGYTDDTVFIITGPMDHLGCWSKIFPTLMQGGTLVILPDGMRDLNAFFDAIEHYRGHKVATFLVPVSIRIILQMDKERLGALGDTIDFIETGAAPMTHSDMLQLCKLLPRTRLYNTYASTETGIVASYNYNDGRCKPGCTGLPLRHSNIIITPEGKIACSGKTLMTRYKNEPASSSSPVPVTNFPSKIRGGQGALTTAPVPSPSPWEDRGGVATVPGASASAFFITNDNGYLDEDGMLHVTGRDDDIINVGGLKVSPIEIEELAMTYPGIRECICIPQEHRLLGFVPKLLCVIQEGSSFNAKAIHRFMSERLEAYKVPQVYQAVEHIEKTFNGKINRKKYRITKTTP